MAGRKFPTEGMIKNMREFGLLTKEASFITKELGMQGMKRNVAIRKYIQLRRKGLSKEEAVKFLQKL